MIALPNPFESTLDPATGVDAAAAPGLTDPPVAAAETFGTECHQAFRRAIDADHRFALDERAFMEAIEPPPAFLGNPSPEYLNATDLMPVLAVLAGH